jgi:hypothetical protein
MRKRFASANRSSTTYVTMSLNENWRQYECNGRKQFDEYVKGGPGSVLERVTDRVTHNGGVVNL